MLEKLGIAKEPFELSVKKEEKGNQLPIATLKGHKVSLLAGLAALIENLHKGGASKEEIKRAVQLGFKSE